MMNLEAVLSSILDLAGRAIPVDAYSIWRRGTDRVWLPAASRGLSDAYVHRALPSTADQISARPMIFSDTGADPLLADRRECYEAEGIKSLAVMPLTIEGEVAGTLVFYSRSPHVFDEVELKLASALADLAGVAITSAKLAEEQGGLVREKEIAQQRTAFLAEASQILASSLDYETTLGAVANLAIGFMADWCTVDIADESGIPRRLSVAHIDPQRRAWAQMLRQLYPPDENDVTARVIRSGEPVLASFIEQAQYETTARDERHLRLLRELSPKSFLCVPMWARGKTLGAMSFLISESKRRYNETDLSLAQDLANRCALAIDNATLYKRATESAALEKESRTELETLNRVGQILAAELNVERLVQAVTDAAMEITGAEFGSFSYEVVDEKGELSIQLSESGAAGGKEAARSRLEAPVISRSGPTLGVLWLGHLEDERFTARHEATIRGIARYAAIALDNARLFEQAQAVHKELRRSNDDLLRANHDLETFAYSASHDLQEPIRQIIISAQMVQRHLASTLDDQTTRHLDAILDAAERMQTLVRDLLTYTQAVRNTDGPVPRIPAASVLNQVLETLRSRIEECDAEVICDDLPEVAMHVVHVNQIFQNLIGNALKYCGSRRPRVEISADRENGRVTFSVQDNGIGIETQYGEQIFGLFKRLHGRDEYPGSGVGLAICKRIVEQYGGRIWLEKSVPGAGSTFCFSIPDGI